MTATTTYASSANSTVVPAWTAILSVPILVRAVVVALILGSALTAINQPGAVFGASALDLLPLALVYVTPFAVVTLSQILGIRQALRDDKPLPAEERFGDTIWRHGIPSRAIMTGLVAGTINSLITISASVFAAPSSADFPLPLITQAYCLPVIFGLVSQAISYRRAKLRLAQARF